MKLKVFSTSQTLQGSPSNKQKAPLPAFKVSECLNRRCAKRVSRDAANIPRHVPNAPCAKSCYGTLSNMFIVVPVCFLSTVIIQNRWKKCSHRDIYSDKEGLTNLLFQPNYKTRDIIRFLVLGRGASGGMLSNTVLFLVIVGH